VCVFSAEYLAVLSESSTSPSENIYECGFEDEFEVDFPMGQCTALYDFDGELLLFFIITHTHTSSVPPFISEISLSVAISNLS